MLEPSELLELYARHLDAPGRRPDTALSLESLNWLNLHGLPEARERLGVIENLADLGTGISSVFYRAWILRNQLTPGTVWSVDTDRRWLDSSRHETSEAMERLEGRPRGPGWYTQTVLGEWWDLGRFLAEYNLGEEWNGPTPGVSSAFQVVALDTAKAGRRHELVGICDELLVDGGLLVLDDWHMPHHSGPTGELLAELGYELQELELETKDQYGRWMAVAWKPVTGDGAP